MKYISAAEAAALWKISERSVRSYCAQGRVEGAFLTGKTWNIPEGADKPPRMGREASCPETLLKKLQKEKRCRCTDGIYHRTQIELAFNSGTIDGKRLSIEQVKEIYDTNCINTKSEAVKIDDIIETANHFRCLDMIIEQAQDELSGRFMRRLHWALKNGSSDSRSERSAAGEYKKHPNVIEGMETVMPENVAEAMEELLKKYNDGAEKTLDDIIRFHVELEKIHPFQTGNGRVGRLIMFKECLKYNIVPFVIGYQWKPFYWRGFREWGGERNFMRDTCLAAQDKYRALIEYYDETGDKYA